VTAVRRVRTLANAHLCAALGRLADLIHAAARRLADVNRTLAARGRGGSRPPDDDQGAFG
jgi:hypothetical protein